MREFSINKKLCSVYTVAVKCRVNIRCDNNLNTMFSMRLRLFHYKSIIKFVFYLL